MRVTRSAVGAGAVTLAAAGLVTTAWLWWYAEQRIGTFGPGAALPGPARALAIGRLAGLLAGYAVIWQLLLAARLPVLERHFGLDRLLRWHRRNGSVVVGLVAVHVATVVLSSQRLMGHASPLSALRSLMSTARGVPLAVAAGFLLLVIGALSLRPVRRRLAYELWYVVHLSAYAAVALALPHQVQTGSTFGVVPAARPFWVGAFGVAAGALIAFRWVRPLVRGRRHRLRVAAVEPETAHVTSLRIAGDDLARLRPDPGQFFIWRVLRRSLWWRPHPLSLSAPADGDAFRISVQAAGNGTRALVQAVRPGDAVLGEGPYGAFTARRCRGRGVVLLGAGVGITPLRALAETLDDRHGIVLLQRVSRPDHVLFRSEFDELARQRDFAAHWLIGPRRCADSWLPVIGDVPGDESDAGALLRLVPDISERDVFVCGPPAWVDLVRPTLQRAGVPRRQVHLEEFSW